MADEKKRRFDRLAAAVTPQGNGAVAWTERNRTRPSDYPLQPCDFKKLARYDSLPIEQACFVLLGFEPPPLHVLRFVQDTYNPSRQPTWDEPPEYSDSLRSLRLSIAHGNISVQRITETPYETEYVSWLELVRWARLKSYTISPELESISAKMAPAALVSLEPQAPPVVAVGASSKAAIASSKRWTPELLTELKAFRDKFGTKQAATHYGISASLVRQKLPREKPKPKGYSAFTHRIE